MGLELQGRRERHTRGSPHPPATGSKPVLLLSRESRSRGTPATGDQAATKEVVCRGREPMETQRRSAAQAPRRKVRRICLKIRGLASFASCSLADTTTERRPFGVAAMNTV